MKLDKNNDNHPLKKRKKRSKKRKIRNKSPMPEKINEEEIKIIAPENTK